MARWFPGCWECRNTRKPRGLRPSQPRAATSAPPGQTFLRGQVQGPEHPGLRRSNRAWTWAAADRTGGGQCRLRLHGPSPQLPPPPSPGFPPGRPPRATHCPSRGSGVADLCVPVSRCGAGQAGMMVITGRRPQAGTHDTEGASSGEKLGAPGLPAAVRKELPGRLCRASS